jgi:hypothetical protein
MRNKIFIGLFLLSFLAGCCFQCPDCRNKCTSCSVTKPPCKTKCTTMQPYHSTPLCPQDAGDRVPGVGARVIETSPDDLSFISDENFDGLNDFDSGDDHNIDQDDFIK